MIAVCGSYFVTIYIRTNEEKTKRKRKRNGKEKNN